MRIFLLTCLCFMYATAEGYNDSTLDGLSSTFQHIWHSYTFNTGAGNREELYFSNVELNSNFEAVNNVFVWKNLQVKEEIVIVGLGNNFLLITTIDEAGNSSSYKQEIPGPTKSLAVFQRWEIKTQQIENFVIVSSHSAEESCTLLWYKITDGRLKFLWDWQYRGSAVHMDVIKINFEANLLIINHQKSTHKKPSAEIYSFNVNHELDIWLFEKIILDGNPSSVTVIDSNDNVFFCASFPSLETIHIFKYSKSLCLDTLEKKRFVLHQKIFSIGLKSVISFQVGFHWHLAVASSSSLVYYMGENLLFHPASTPPLGDINYWLPVPVDTYRDDTILLADSNADVSVVSWTGNEDLKIFGSFTKLVCRDSTECSGKMKKVALNESLAFTYKGQESLIISAKNETPLFFKLSIKLKPLPDKTLLKLKEILNEKNMLEKNYTTQNEQIGELSKKNSSKIVFSDETFERKKEPQTSSQTKVREVVSKDVDQLKSTTESLELEIKALVTKLQSGYLKSNGTDSEALSGRYVAEGITFHGNVLISELNLTTLNGYSVNKLFTETFRQNNPMKIGGTKTIKKLNSDNVMFENLGDILACDIVFTEDPCEDQNKNIINGDIIWENNLTILNDVKPLQDGIKQNASFDKMLHGTLRPSYDQLNFKDLEISEDFYVQSSINDKPVILPVHSGELNILDIVHQVRFEAVNVEQNLSIVFINGRNFTALADKILRDASQLELDSIKVDGVFSAASIEANEINGIDLRSISAYEHDFDSDRMSENIIGGDSDNYIAENNLKRSEKEQMRRIIHVFDNLEIDGILFSNKINNVSWAVLNDTVKKNEKTVTFTGTKTFQKPLKATKAILNGTINGRFVDNVMTDFSNQTIRHSQMFYVVKFKNLSVEGSWDGVSVNQLNTSLLRLSIDNGQNTNLTFKDECSMNVLNVVNSVNGVGLNRSPHKSHNGKIELKSIKASHLTLHGSLITNNRINNMNLTNFNMLRVSLKSPEVLDQDIYHYNVSVAGDLNVETLNFNDVSSIINSRGDTKLVDDFMNGKIHKIKKLLVKGNITTSGGVNGVNLSKVFEKGIKINEPESLEGNVTFESNIYFDNLNVTDSVDGFSLKNFEKDIAFKHSHVYLTGPKNFSTLKVTKAMRARTLNGHLMQNVVSLKGDHAIKGPIRINGDVIVRGNITSYSALNNISIPDLLKTYSTRFNSFIYSGDLTLRSEEVTVRNLSVGGKIQNVSLKALIDDSIKKSDGVNGLFNVSGKKTFKGEVKFKENVTVNGLIHGINVTEFYSDLAFVNKPTILRGKLTVQELVLKDLEVTGHFNATLINNIDTNDWLEDSIPLDKYDVISGKKTFEDAHSLQDVSVDFINGHLPSSMISLKKKQHIPTLALFPRIHSLSDISVGGHVNGMNLRDEFEDSVLLYGSQTLKGFTVFETEVVVNGSLFVDTIRGKEVNSLVTLDTEQIIKTPLRFEGIVTAKQDVDDLEIINNINVTDWNERSVSLNKEQVLSGIWTVKGKVIAKNIKGDGLLYSVSLPEVSEKVKKSRERALEIKNETESEYFAQCCKVDQLSEYFSHLPYLLDQFEAVNEIETHSVIESVITFKIANTDSLIVTFVNECLSSLYQWNKESVAFDYKGQINIGSVNKWLTIQRDDATYLVTSSPSNMTCEKGLQRGNVWVFKAGDLGYTHLLTTNAFIDVTQENRTSAEFFTIDGSGVLQLWTLQKDGNITAQVLHALGPDNFKFIDFKIMGNLSVSNGREIKQITRTHWKVTQRDFSLLNTQQLIALSVDGKILTAAVARDKIVIYENLLEDKIYSIIHTYKPGSVLWLNYGRNKQAFLIVSSHHKLIEVFEYKSVSGMVKKMSIQMHSIKLQSVNLPVQEKHRSDNFVIVIQKKKIIFLRAQMFGDHFEKSYSFC